MTTKQLEQIFNDNSDCYADTWEDSGGEMHNGCHMMREGESISAMTLPKFIEVVSKLSQPPIDNKAVEEWISVEDRLPDVSEKYGESDYLLCIDEHNNQEFVGWYSNKYGWKVAHYMAISSEVKVTHWQPLPKKPKTLPSNHQQSNPPK